MPKPNQPKRNRSQVTCTCGLLDFPHRATTACETYYDEQAEAARDERETIRLDNRDRARDMRAEFRKGAY